MRPDDMIRRSGHLKLLITGGAGFVGSHLARAFKHSFPRSRVVVFDNLHRRGSEINLEGFKRLGIEFVQGDIRVPHDLQDLAGTFDVLIEASAEPSVQAGIHASPYYAVDTNLTGTLHCLEFARNRVGRTVFLSTSRVYSISPLRDIPLSRSGDRFEIRTGRHGTGWGAQGVSEDFPTHLPRSLYGATKLASELILQEYVQTYKIKAVINRCGVIAGAGQFGKVDQGVFTLWMAHHYFGRPLRYTGFGGTGKQVRDLLHPQDLFRLLQTQLARMERHNGKVFNVGGGRPISVSLREMTFLCREISGRKVQVASDARTSPVDIPLYLSDTRKVRSAFGWRPRFSVRDILDDIHDWLRIEESRLKPLFS
jgi:CDP-paratose 2-epimerase